MAFGKYVFENMFRKSDTQDLMFGPTSKFRPDSWRRYLIWSPEGPNQAVLKIHIWPTCGQAVQVTVYQATLQPVHSSSRPLVSQAWTGLNYVGLRAISSASVVVAGAGKASEAGTRRG